MGKIRIEMPGKQGYSLIYLLAVLRATCHHKLIYKQGKIALMERI